MKFCVHESSFRTITPVLTLLVIAAVACSASGQPMGFVEDFTGPNLDEAWQPVDLPGGDPAGHPDPNALAGTYDITDAHGSPGTTLRRSTGGSVGSFTHQIELVLNPHLLTGPSGTQSDFKWKSNGADGLVEVVYNSFGDLRVNHNNSNTNNSGHIAGGSPDNINIGYSDGDVVEFTIDYNSATDTIDVTYSLNGETPVIAYSGTGIDGQFGDVITNAVEVEVFKFGNNLSTQTVASIDSWSLLGVDVTGDFDADGDVDGSDFLVWQRGDSPLGGTADELADWEANYGPQPLTVATTAVPEPSCIVLVLTSAAMLGISRWL